MSLSIPLLLFAMALSGEAAPVEADTTANPNPQVLMATSQGDVVIEIFADKAPISAKNFLDYVQAEHFDGLLFHRVIPGFMVQGGGLNDRMQKVPTGPPILNESDNGLANLRGTLSMARTAVPHSATGQFFVNLVDNPSLDHKGGDSGWGYAVFGKVKSGMEAIDAIAKVATGYKSGMRDVPLEPVFIKSIRLVE